MSKATRWWKDNIRDTDGSYAPRRLRTSRAYKMAMRGDEQYVKVCRRFQRNLDSRPLYQRLKLVGIHWDAVWEYPRGKREFIERHDWEETE